ncbi:MAG: alpha-D-ribose 1-methylphosphonate 5-phosphate C-P-lyase PhnJ [Rubrimonas sp.]|uniref:alpha-D-ribose 1-methylphosphonate 5-phosphate C-P-lyase PhnJ n=1 Tax=Rubrimonas sp. TaxID=2036015 RepID=UPI002FDE8D8D
MTLAALARSWRPYAYGFLDASAKREIRRRLIKAVAIPGCQVPYASREVPIARGWGTGGLQVSLTLATPRHVVKVIDQGADDSVNAASIRSFIARVSGAATTLDTQAATLIQSRHRIPEEILRPDQILVLQVPNPEPLRPVEPNMSVARRMHADADYGRLWLTLYEQIVRSGRVMQGASYPALVNGRHVMTPSPIPRWDLPKLHMARHLTILAAGREKRLYAVPPFTRVEPLVFSDIPYRIEDHAGLTCRRSGLSGFFMNEIPRADGGAEHEVSDSHLGVKAIRARDGDGDGDGESVEIGATWYVEGRMRR